MLTEKALVDLVADTLWPGHATEKERLADSIGRGSEMADLIVHKVRDRGAHSPVEAE